MRIRSLGASSPHSHSAWPSRTACILIASLVVLFAVGIVRNVRRHDVLTEWRQSLESATNRPTWPEWSYEWPPLPETRRRRQQAPQDLHGVYAYAATHWEVLEKIPCYCGCARDGHRSNLSCFVSSFRQDGTPVWTDHSFSCPMCVHIAREVMLMTSQGLSVERVRLEIDTRYGDQGPRTDTPPVSDAASHQR